MTLTIKHAKTSAKSDSADATIIQPSDWNNDHTFTGVLGVANGGTGGLSFARNKIINGDFRINQRGYASGGATSAGTYTFDRWKVTASGGITYSTTSNKTTVTIGSGQTLQQVIEGLNLQTGTYVLSWEGTAQGRIAGGSYGASGAVTASITGGTNTTIEFNAGTVANVQLEIGSVATPFEHRPYGAELQLCQRYYEIFATSTDSVTPFQGIVAYFATTTQLRGCIPLRVTKRAAPTATIPTTNVNINYAGGNANATATASTYVSTDSVGLQMSLASGSSTVGYAATINFFTGNPVIISAEL